MSPSTISIPDLQSIRRLLEHDASGSVCPSCRISFDKGKRRKLIDTCGHERCYSCMFRNDQCPMCMNSSLKGEYKIRSSDISAYRKGGRYVCISALFWHISRLCLIKLANILLHVECKMPQKLPESHKKAGSFVFCVERNAVTNGV